jgi:hypothetical protein
MLTRRGGNSGQRYDIIVSFAKLGPKVEQMRQPEWTLTYAGERERKSLIFLVPYSVFPPHK